MEQKIKTIIVTHKDRFIRFGYDWFEKFCMKFHTTIVVVNNEELSPQDELVQDIVSILHVFSCRLYGLRKYKKQIEGDEEIAKELQNGNKPDSRAKSRLTRLSALVDTSTTSISVTTKLYTIRVKSL